MEALNRSAEDIQGYYNNTDQPLNTDNENWQVFADMFKGVIIYE